SSRTCLYSRLRNVYATERNTHTRLAKFGNLPASHTIWLDALPKPWTSSSWDGIRSKRPTSKKSSGQLWRKRLRKLPSSRRWEYDEIQDYQGNAQKQFQRDLGL